MASKACQINIRSICNLVLSIPTSVIIVVVPVVVGASTLYCSYIQEFLGNSLTFWHGSSNSGPSSNNIISTSSSGSIYTVAISKNF